MQAGSFWLDNIVLEKAAEASIGETYYATLEEAVEKAVANDTITLHSNVTLDARLDINKRVTINGNGHTITGNVELQNGQGGNLIANNVIFTNLNVTNQTLNATDCRINTLGVGGTGGVNRVTLTNCAVTNLNTYGYVTLAGTSSITGETTISGISGNWDKPQIILNDTSTVSGALTFANTIDLSANLGYQLVSGNIANFKAEWNNDTYKIDANGQIALQATEPVTGTVTKIATTGEGADVNADAVGYYGEITLANGQVPVWTITRNADNEFVTKRIDTATVDGLAKVGLVLYNFGDSSVTDYTISLTAE